MCLRLNSPLLFITGGLSAISIGLASPVLANSSAGDEAELEALMSILDEETHVAKQTRANADYLPGIVTVLHGKDLIAQGRQTVFDALSLAPGVQTTRGSQGNMVVLIRGMRHSQFGGNALIMLNSVPMVSSTAAQSSTVLSIPTSQVERIEVTRGPGSSSHGEYAQTGVINIITHKQGTRLSLHGNSHDTAGVSGYTNGEHKKTGLRWHANLSTWSSGGAGTPSGPDSYTALGLGHAPGPVDDRQQNRFALLGFDLAGFSANINLAEYRTGGFFGNRSLPSSDLPAGNDRHWAVKLRQHLKPSDTLDLSFQFNVLDYRSNEGPQISIPALGTLNGPPGAPTRTTPVDILRLNNYTERRYDISSNATWTGIEGHTVNVAVGYSDVELTESATWSNLIPPATIAPSLQVLTGRFDHLPTGQSRRIRYAMLQDEFSPMQDVYLTGSVRYDSYSDLGDHLSPRLAAIWQATPKHALKLQYSEAIRPPTFFELHSVVPRSAPRRVSMQVQKSSEIGYIYRHAGSVGRATLFNTRILSPTNPIAPAGNFAEGPTLKLHGAELEWSSPLSSRWTLGSNLSYLDATSAWDDARVPGSYRWLFNLNLEGKITARWQVNIDTRMVSEQRGDGPNTGTLPGHKTLDLSVSGRNLMNTKGLNLSAGIRNLFDDDVIFTAAPGSYANGLPQPGRQLWMHLSYDL